MALPRSAKGTGIVVAMVKDLGSGDERKQEVNR